MVDFANQAATTAQATQGPGPASPSAGKQSLVEQINAPAAEVQLPAQAAPAAQAGLAGPVGIGAANAPADVTRVIDRLTAVGYLSAADAQAERTAVAALTGQVPDARIPHTLAALLRFLRETGGSTVQQVAPGSAEETVLDSPPTARDQPTVSRVQVAGSVGAGGGNARGDVRAVQDRLKALGYLAAADYTAERAPATGTAPVTDAHLVHTIAAITRMSLELIGPPGVQQIAPGSAAEQAMNAPAHTHAPAAAAGSVALTGAVGAGGANAAADVRAVQDRLLAIGYLTQANHGAERVAPTVTGAVADSALVQTIAAIQRFHREVLASSLAQIRPGADEQALNHPPAARVAAADLTTSVGTGGVNGAASVRTVQERLHDLGYLADADFTAEQVVPTGGNAAVTALARTIAAIQAMQTALGRGRVTATGLIAPGDVSHRLLMNPGMPVPQTIALTGRVGRGGPNHAADVLLVQGRLTELGFLTSANALAEQPAPGVANVPAGALPQTIAAIEAFQGAIVGVTPDGQIDAGGLSARLLQDPTYGTRTVANPNATNASAGPAPANFAHEVQQIITACEQIEGGAGGRGERPAVLRNGSGTPASFGKSQLIGGTAVGTLQHNPNIAAIYGLTPEDLTNLSAVATRTVAHYDAIFHLVPAGGAASDAALLQLATNYITANGERFHVETNLFDSDIIQMFRTAQLRRHMAGQAAGAAATLMNAQSHPASAANIAALGLSQSDVNHYIANPSHNGEHKQGFVTRALMMSDHGQQLRDAMTDNGGTGIGRALINDNFALVTARAAQLNIPLTVAQRAQVTARVHNQGESQLNAFLQNLPGTAANGYVVNFSAVWVP